MESATDAQQDLYLPKEKFKYLILGGFGFIGQAFTAFLYNKGDCAFESIVIADKKHKMFARIPKAREEIYNDERIKAKQIDLSREKEVVEMFETMGPFDIVVNCAAETRYDMAQEEYVKNTVKVAEVCGKTAQAFGVKKFIHLSNCLLYGSTKSPADEKTKPNPTYTQGKIALAGEAAITQIKDLPYKILRLPIVYGPYDLEGYVSVTIVGAIVYKHQKEQMKVLWDDSKRIHTVHVHDVCRAIAFLISSKETKQNLYNLVDEGDTTQARYYSVLSKVVGVSIECVGSFKSHFASLMLDSVISKMNDRHLRTWFEILQQHKIPDSPLNVKVYREMCENTNLSVNGSLIRSEGFKIQHKWMSVQLLDDVVKSYIEEEYLPKQLL